MCQREQVSSEPYLQPDVTGDQLFSKRILVTSLALRLTAERGEPSLGTSICAITVGFMVFLTTDATSCFQPYPILQLLRL